MRVTGFGLPGLLLLTALLAGCGSSSSGGSSISVAAKPPSSLHDIENARANLRNLATAEETYLTDYNQYTTSSDGLTYEGFTREPGTTDDTIVGGVDGSTGYCLISSPSAGDVWILYDSMAGGIQPTTYPSQAGAEAGCSQPKITDFQTLTLTAAATSPPQETIPASSSPELDGIRADLRNLATAEETYLVDHLRYTASSAGLAAEGFTPEPGTEADDLEVGFNADRGYCLIGGTSAGDAWILYDSENGGIQDALYPTQAQATTYCSDPKITSFDSLG